MEIEYSELKGMKVVGSTGNLIGIVEDIKIDTEDWRSRAIVVKVDRNIEEYLELEPRNTPFF
ncbi:MAG: PRC-barrel domain-containing protein, partial [Thermoplasmata archaeon]